MPEREKAEAPDAGRQLSSDRVRTFCRQAHITSFADADRVRAQLALLGVESKVQRVSIDNDTWHRVRIGPIEGPQGTQSGSRAFAAGGYRGAGDQGRGLETTLLRVARLSAPEQQARAQHQQIQQQDSTTTVASAWRAGRYGCRRCPVES